MSPLLGAQPVGGKPALPPHMFVTIRTSDSRHTLTALMGQAMPTITDGRGGWSEVARSRKPSVIEWLGPSTHKATVEILLDEWQRQGSVESAMATVDAIAPLTPTTETPVVYVSGVPTIPATTPWVVQAAVPSDWVLRPDGRITRVTYAFDLLQWRQGDVVVRNSPAKSAAAKAGTTRGKARVHTVKAHETLSSIAATFLGSASKWQTIATLNGLRSPNNLRVGQVLKLP